MTRRKLLQLATSALLIPAKTGFAQNGASPAPIPRSQYSPLAAERAQGHAPQEPDTWYEFLLKQFNPGKVDYGAIIEERRRALLDATVNNPYFPFSVAMTIWNLVVMSAFAKLWFDGKRKDHLNADIVADLYNHDLHSRQVAKEAIEKYNQHIEQCNRAIEDSGSGQSPSGERHGERRTQGKIATDGREPPGHDPGKRRAEGGTDTEVPRRDRPQLAGAGADGPDEREWQGACRRCGGLAVAGVERRIHEADQLVAATALRRTR